MNRLPQDLYELISAYITDRDDAEALLTVSREWQVTIERQKFRHVTARSTNGLPRLREVFARKERRQYLKVLTYNIVLPAYREDQRVLFEDSEDRAVNDEAFTTAIHELFIYLKEWDNVDTSGISFVLGDIYSLSDHEANKISSPFLDMSRATFEIVRSPSWVHRWQMTPYAKRTLDLLNWRHRYSHLLLLRLDSLPDVPIIHSFSTAPRRTREINDLVSIELAMKLPNLVNLNVRMANVDKKYVAHWRNLRQEFASAIEETLPKLQKLHTLEIWTNEKSHWMPEFAKPRAYTTDCGPDALSSAIHNATKQLPKLRHLNVNNYIDPSLLRSNLDGMIKVPPYWQNLETLVIKFERPWGKPFLFDKHHNTIPLSADTLFPPGYSDEIYRPQNEEELRKFADQEARMRSTFTNMKRSLGLKSREKTTLEERFMASKRTEMARYFVPYRTLDWYPYKVLKSKDPTGPLLQAFGHACCQLPKLRAAGLYTTRALPFERRSRGEKWYQEDVKVVPWGVWYLGPGFAEIRAFENVELPFEDEEGFDQHMEERRVIWDTRQWKPDPELFQLYNRIGQERYGRPAVAKTRSRW